MSVLQLNSPDASSIVGGGLIKNPSILFWFLMRSVFQTCCFKSLTPILLVNKDTAKCHTHTGHKRGAHLPFCGHWARRWIDHRAWRIASTTPDLRLPSQPQSITALWPPVPNYTAWWTEARVWTTYPRLLPGSAPSGSQTCNLRVTSLACYHYTTKPQIMLTVNKTVKSYQSRLQSVTTPHCLEKSTAHRSYNQ